MKALIHSCHQTMFGAYIDFNQTGTALKRKGWGQSYMKHSLPFETQNRNNGLVQVGEASKQQMQDHHCTCSTIMHEFCCKQSHSLIPILNQFMDSNIYIVKLH